MRSRFTLRSASLFGAASALVLAFSQLLTGCEEVSSSVARVPPTVRVAPIQEANGSRDLRLSGTLSAERSVALSFSTIGTVERVEVQEGQAVRQGDTLATLVRATYEDALGIAEAKAGQAEDAYRRLQPMYRNGTLPEVRMVEVETGRAQARLAVSMARKNLDDTVLRASASGTIAERNVEPGSAAAPLAPAFTLVQTVTMMATAPVPETQIGRVQRGMPARVTVPALGRTFEGSVREISVVANPLTRTYDAKVAIANSDGALRIGMIADVRLRVTGDEPGLLAPPEAVRVDENGQPYVFVVDDTGSVQRRQVQLTGFSGEGTMLTGDVRAGESVVISGTPMLANGMSVRVLGQRSGAE